jgi:hypothetical protein
MFMLVYDHREQMFSKQAIVFLHKWQVSWMKKTTHLVVMIICFMTIWCLGSCHNISNFTACDAEGQWPNQGGGLFNTRHAYSKKINSSTISKLALKWQFNAGFDVFVTPSVSNDGIIYFPTFNGNFYALDAKTGNVLWARNLTSFISDELLIEFPNIHSDIPFARIFSRMTPVITKHSALLTRLSGKRSLNGSSFLDSSVRGVRILVVRALRHDPLRATSLRVYLFSLFIYQKHTLFY